MAPDSGHMGSGGGEDRTAYVNARLIDPASGLDTPGALLSVNGKIADFGPRLFADGVPAGTAVVDCQGRCLVPGLIDMHAHLCLRDGIPWARDAYDQMLAGAYTAHVLEEYLDQGFTTARDTGCNVLGIAKGVNNDRELALHLLEKYELAALPGSAFHSVRDFCLRVSSSFIDAATDQKANALVDAFRADPDPERFIQDHHPRLRKVVERFGEFLEDLENPA